MLRKKPGFTAITLVILAMCIGTNTIMFSVSDVLLLDSSQVKDSEQLAFCAITDAEFSFFLYSGYLTVRDDGMPFSDVMAQDVGVGTSSTVVHGDLAWQVPTKYVSANYFSFLGIPLALGRGFLPEEERQGGAHVVVLSHRIWRRLGGDPKIIGKFLSVNGIDCQVVGIAPKGFTGVEVVGPRLWLPLGSYSTLVELPQRTNAGPDWGYPLLHVVGRLKPDLSMPAAQRQLQSLVPHFKVEDPEGWRDYSSFSLRPPGRFRIEGDSVLVRRRLTLFSLVLMAGSAIILVIGCVNLMRMLIVQGFSRRREMAVRLAMGGGRWRMIRLLLTESLLLALLGGTIGILLAFWGTRILNVWIASAPQEGVKDFRLGLNVRVLGATLGFCLMATLLFGLRPALWLSKRDIAGEMKGVGGRLLGALGRKRGSLSVAGQTALTASLVLCGTLLTRSAIANVGRDYFAAMEIPLLQGRLFDPRDRIPNAEKVAIIDESLARRLHPDGHALGSLIQWGLFAKADTGPFRVVGVVVHLPGIGDREVHAQMYVPSELNGVSPYFCLHVASERSVDVLRRRITQEIRRVDPMQALRCE